MYFIGSSCPLYLYYVKYLLDGYFRKVLWYNFMVNNTYIILKTSILFCRVSVSGCVGVASDNQSLRNRVLMLSKYKN